MDAEADPFDPNAAWHRDFLARLLTERRRLERAIAVIDAMVPIYEALIDGAAGPDDWKTQAGQLARAAEATREAAEGAPRKPVSPARSAASRANFVKARAALAAKRTVQEPGPAPPPPTDWGAFRFEPVAPAPKPIMAGPPTVSRAVEPVEPVDPGEPIAADFEQVRRWAAERGAAFGSWDDLPEINRRRERLGLATFKRVFGPRGG